MHVRVIWRRDRYLRGSDHISFLERGYPAGRFTEPHENFAHQHQDVRVENGVQFGDLPEFCDFDYIARVARVNLATVWSLAQGPGTPKGVVIVTTNLTNDTPLRWQAGTEPDLAGYEIVWRETTRSRLDPRRRRRRRHRGDRSTSRRTTSSSASAPTTATATAARSPSRCPARDLPPWAAPPPRAARPAVARRPRDSAGSHRARLDDVYKGQWPPPFERRRGLQVIVASQRRSWRPSPSSATPWNRSFGRTGPAGPGRGSGGCSRRPTCFRMCARAKTCTCGKTPCPGAGRRRRGRGIRGRRAFVGSGVAVTPCPGAGRCRRGRGIRGHRSCAADRVAETLGA